MTNTRNDARDKVFLDVVNSMRSDFPGNAIAWMTPDKAVLTAANWADHLKDIPVERVMEIYQSLVREDDDPPTVSDFAQVWSDICRIEHQQAQDKKRESEDKELRRQYDAGAGRIGAMVAHLAQQRWDAGLDAVCCDCTTSTGSGVVATLTGDGEYFRCESGNCNFRQPVSKLMEIRVHSTFKPAGNCRQSKRIESETKPESAKTIPTESKRELVDDNELLQQLDSRCNIDCSIPGREKSIDFGRFYLKQYPVLSSWNQETARAAWREFQQEVRHANAA